MISKKYPLFGSEVEFFLDADKVLCEPALNEAYALALKLQKIFNIYDPKSEISLLNRNRQIKASFELREVMIEALRLCELSNGEYDVSLGKMFLQRKKGQSLVKLSCSYKDIVVGEENVILHNPDVWIDLGSIAKGYIAERVAEFFMEQGIESGYIDARGDLKVFGDVRKIDVQHPRNEGAILTINVQNKGVATSGDYRQYDKDYSSSHILNQKDIISATVVSDNLMNADAYATILMICGPDARERMIKEAGFPAMTIDKNLKIRYYNGFEGLVNNEI